MRDLLTMLQTQFEFKFRLIRSSHVEKQQGFNEDPQSKDELINEVLCGQDAVGKKSGWVAPDFAVFPLL